MFDWAAPSAPEHAFVDGDGKELVVVPRPDGLTGIPEDSVDLARGDFKFLGNFALMQPLAGKIENFKLPISQDCHELIESIGTNKIKSPTLGTRPSLQGVQGEWIVY